MSNASRRPTADEKPTQAHAALLGRRDFLKASAGATTAALAVGLLGVSLESAEAAAPCCSKATEPAPAVATVPPDDGYFFAVADLLGPV